MYEVELKFVIENCSEIEQKLTALFARWSDPIQQIDHYFSHPCRDFSKTDEALRLRQGGERVELTWKGPRIDQSTKTRQELELPITNGPNKGLEIVDQWTAMLSALGFCPFIQVVKTRRPAHVDWDGIGVDVAIDTIENMGHFLELEIRSKSAEIPAARRCLESLAKALGCSHPERRSYVECILAAREPATGSLAIVHGRKES